MPGCPAGRAFHVSRVLVRDEATRSSAIEGTQTTLDELLNADAAIEEAEQRGEADAIRGELGTVRAYALALHCDVLPGPRSMPMAGKADPVSGATGSSG